MSLPTVSLIANRSRRRGALSNDPEVLERREWYEILQKKFSDDWKDKGSQLADTVVQVDNRNVIPSKVTSSHTPQVKSKEFTSSMVTLAEKSSSKAAVEAEAEAIDEISNGDKYLKTSTFSATDWIIPLNRPDNSDKTTKRKILLLFPGMGYNALIYKDMATYFNGQPMIEIFSCCYPGRMSRVNECMPKSIDPIAGAICEAMIDLCIIPKLPSLEIGDQSLIFFGHCMGSLIAFEVARLLKRKGYSELLTYLIISSLRSPDVLTDYNQDKFGKKYYFCSNGELMNRMVELDGISKRLSKARGLMALAVPLFRADYYLLEKYSYKVHPGEHSPPLTCRILTIGADDDLGCNMKHLHAWKALTSSKSYHFSFSKGGHIFFKENPVIIEQLVLTISALSANIEANPYTYLKDNL